MAKLCSLFSGSKGNCTYIGSGSSGILIDAGVSAKRIEQALLQRDINPASIEAIFVTHEHSDHIAGVRVFSSRYGCQVYASAGTLDGMKKKGIFIEDNYHSISNSRITNIGDLQIARFFTPHDANESCDYIIETPDERRIAICTDLGHVTGEIKALLSGCDFVLLESNHDVKMLENGPYPYPLQQRILGPQGHLSNETCSALLPELIKAGVTQIKLGHLSEINNRPSIAEEAAVSSLTEAGCIRDQDYRLSLAKQESDDSVLWL